MKTPFLSEYLLRPLIWVSVILYVIEVTMFGTTTSSLDTPPFFLWSERVIASIFTIEFFLRLNREKGYCKTFLFWVDLVSIIPFWIGFFIPESWLSWVRTLRVLRLLKTIRYNKHVKILYDSFVYALPSLWGCLITMFIVCLFSSSLIYQVESVAQPDKFDSMWSCLYFCLTTATTTGFGDLSPITPIGRIMTILTLYGPAIALCGIIFGIMSDSYNQTIKKSLTDKD